MLTVDASVFISAVRPSEPYISDSDAFVARVVREGIPVTCPSLVVSEVAAALARTSGDAGLIAMTLRQLESLPGLQQLSLTTDRAKLAAELATTYRLRGADAVYAQAATEAGATLVTWDREMLTRPVAGVTALTPADWLTAHPLASDDTA